MDDIGFVPGNNERPDWQLGPRQIYKCLLIYRMIDMHAVTVVIKTLADPTRRAVFERISTAGEVTVGDLVRDSGVSQPAISQHLRTLREAGLVAERRNGRHVHYRAEPRSLAPLVDWMHLYGAFWRRHFDALEKLLKDIDE